MFLCGIFARGIAPTGPSPAIAGFATRRGSL
ncbi:conserved hypothetical protein [Brucella melitensis M5-90]|uniref:Uncharacterized protein n=3 Tax=Brucella TaxID=234 RepID=A9M8Z0_BRUC2|nr:hypothetical protein BOV_0472 [Brucella ovis ATCC 25840]ABX61554.1 Hypothetical protein, conserved [Brucella canis ATCC 23365]ABY37581.1 Hypothetical protein, conserved [Brucella suis ATCC 23445]ADZ86428.1 conserved hypothetical protein [Brucella melitensis M5-90]